jgi:hypothetical protein
MPKEFKLTLTEIDLAVIDAALMATPIMQLIKNINAQIAKQQEPILVEKEAPSE